MVKKITLLSFLVLVLFSLLPFTSAQTVNSSYTANYNPEVSESFNNQTWVRVSVRLVDNSNITIAGTKEEKRELLRQRDEWFKSKNKIFLSTLPKDYFNVLSNLTDGFVGMITKGGFDTLVNDTRVNAIYLDKMVHGQVSDNNSIKEGKVIEQEKKVEIESSQNNEVKQSKSFLSKIVNWIKSLFSS